MNIAEAERRTGLSRANIRFYEKEGLLTPTRGENGYRDYTEDDVQTLRKIMLLRRLRLSVPDIRAIESGEKALPEAAAGQLDVLQGDIRESELAYAMCRAICEDRAEWNGLDIDRYQSIVLPADDPREKDRIPPAGCPWRRFFARNVDAGLYGLLWSMLSQWVFRINPDHFMSNFTENERTVLLLCEEGIEEYDEKWLLHYGTALVPIESEDRLTPNILKRVEQKYQPDRILVEYNGMWKLEKLMQAFPARWELYQIVTTVDATTFELYSNNIGPMMFEHITTADLVVFNRCTDELKDMLYKKNIKAMNPRAAIYLDDVNGNSEDYARNMPLPFDVDADIIDIQPEDYGLWYIDATGDPMKYDGKTVRFLAQAYVGKDVPAGSFVPGRFGMVCCADDVTFLGFLCSCITATGSRSRRPSPSRSCRSTAVPVRCCMPSR